MTPREIAAYRQTRLRYIERMLEEAQTSGALSAYEISEILHRVEGNLQIWVEDPDNIRHREVVEIEDALIHGPGEGSILLPRMGVGRRPMEAELETPASTEVDPESMALPGDAAARLVKHDAKVLGRLIKFAGQTPEERARLCEQAMREIELEIGDRIPRKRDSGDG